MALTSDETRLKMEIECREVELQSEKPDEPLNQTCWVVFSARGFQSEREALAFGNRLRARIELAALSARIGVDCGSDKETSGLSVGFARRTGLIRGRERIVGNVHGLMILPDDDLTKVSSMDATIRTTHNPVQLVGAIVELSEAELVDLGSCAASVRLLNSALINPDPLARSVLSFSAVEGLGQDETWSERQKCILERMASDLKAEAADDDQEIQEIADAVRRGLHKIGLRQGVMRVLDRLDLSRLRGDWNRLYKIRSDIVHGLDPVRGRDLGQLCYDITKLCGKIVLANAKDAGIRVPSVAQRHFAS